MPHHVAVRSQRQIATAAVAALVLCATPSSPEPSTTTVEAGPSSISAAYDALESALRRGDIESLAAILAPNFTEESPDGSTEGRDAYLKDATASAKALTLSAVVIDHAEVDVTQTSARAKTTYTIRGSDAGNGAPKPFEETIRTTDEWSKSNGAWTLDKSVVHESATYAGGKLVYDDREQTEPTTAAIRELRERAAIVPTLARDADPDQLAPIGAAIGTTRIVGMGEGSHGTSEFFAFKERLFKYFVLRKNFTIFALEIPWGSALAVDRYIDGAGGTAAQVVAAMKFWTWNTPEVVDLVQWMHDYNASPAVHDKLTFAGIDMQDPTGAVAYLEEYLTESDPAHVKPDASAVECTTAASDRSDGKLDDCLRIAALANTIAKSRQDARSVAAPEAATVVDEYVTYRKAPEDKRTEIRDKDMAENVEWLARTTPVAKIAIWAHNGHVGTTPELSYLSMGRHLRDTFGENYYALGQTFGRGTVRGYVADHGLRPTIVESSPRDTLVELFDSLSATAFLDLRSLPANSPLRTFFATPRSIREIGAIIDPLHPDEKLAVLMKNSFDGLVYVPRSTATVRESSSL